MKQKTKWQFFTFSGGNFANTLAYQVLGNRVQFYYIDVLGLSPALAGVVWTVYGIWNMINDPLMGQVTDRTRSKMGRRIPYLYFGAIPLGLSFFFLWTPFKQNPYIMALYFFMALFIFDTIYSLTIIAYNALFPEIAKTIVERVSLSTIREILAVFGLLTAYIVGPILSDSVGYVAMGAIIGVLVAIGYLITPLGLKELPVPKDEVNVGMLDSLKIVLSSIPFRYFVGFNLMKEYVFLILGAMLPFWRKYVLGITGPAMVFGTKMGAGDQEAILLGVPFILMIPLLLIWQRIVPRLGSRMSWMVGNALFLPGLIIMTLANNFYTGLLGTALIAPGLAVYQLLPLPMISEIIDDDGSKHGYRREGIFMGMSSGIVRAAFSLQGVLLGTVFSISGYVNGAAVQSISAIWGIRFLIGITPIISIVISYLLLWKFPFGRERVTNKPVAAVDSVG